MRGVSSTTLVPGTATFKIKLGGTTIITGTTAGLLGSLTNSNFYLSLTIACLNPGSSGSVVCSGEIDYVSGVNALKSAIPLNLASTAVDTTSDQSLDVSVTWGLSGNSITILTATLELLPMV
jgi:hypothetical protein